MSESVDATHPESMPLSLQVFHDGVQHSFGDPTIPEALAEQQTMLADIISQAVALQPEAPAQQAIQAYGKIIEYAWFGTPDEQPPDEIVYASVYAGEHGELMLGNHILTPTMFDDITSMLKLQMLPLLALRARNLERNRDTLLRTIQSYLALTPVGKALHQLGSNNDPSETRRPATYSTAGAG